MSPLLVHQKLRVDSKFSCHLIGNKWSKVNRGYDSHIDCQVTMLACLLMKCCLRLFWI